jgi:adenosylhomocysteinase
LTSSRIKDPTLASQIDAGELAWHRQITPITEHYCNKISKKNYCGKRAAFWGHVTFNMLPMILALKEAGADLLVGACNVDSTNDAIAAYLDSQGVLVYAWSGMSQHEYQENLKLAREFDADYVSDMGGELTTSYIDREQPLLGALEATTSGLRLLREHELPFPVFDWNSIPLKEKLENRFHVGDGVWPAFSQVTGLGVFGRRVLVIGFGPVGKGIAERARKLGAMVNVADIDPVRLIEARHHGCEPIDLADGLSRAHVIVTATGAKGVLNSDNLSRINSGAIIFNAGHSNREADIDWLYQQPHRRMKAHIERFDISNTSFYLLGKGSLLNLAAHAGPHGTDLFDHYTAVMLRGMSWMFNGIPNEYAPGLQFYPEHLEREIAARSVEIYQ